MFDRSGSLSGEVELDGPALPGSYSVQLVGSGSSAMVERAMVDGNGMFHFNGVRAGQYSLRVVTEPDGEIITEQSVRVDPTNSYVHLFATGQRQSNGVGGVISKRELSIPAKARAAFVDGSRFMEQSKWDKAIAKFETALKVYPDYFEARTNLGNVYFHQGNMRAALASFEKAAETGPVNALVQVNLALAYFQFQRFADAETALRRALDAEPKSAMAHFLLGALFVREGHLEEAIPHLDTASAELPQARALRARIIEIPVNTATAKK